jgi:hypothetical protein
MALRRQIVDLVRLHLLDDANQIGGVGQIPIVQHQPAIPLVRAAERASSAPVEAAG